MPYSVEINDKVNNHFKEFAGALYLNDIYWMKNEDVYPKEAKYFLVYKDNKIIGRACGIINPEISYQNKKTCLIGFYECSDDFHASKILFEAVEDYFRENGFEYLIGPMNGSTWCKYRITEPATNPPFMLDNYHKSWHLSHFVENGFVPIARYLSTKTDNLDKSYARLEKFEKRYSEKGIKIRHIKLNEFPDEMRNIFDISLKSFKNNFLYSKISFDEFLSLYSRVKEIVNPEFVFIAEDARHKALGFIFAINDIFSRDKKSLVIKTVATIPGNKGRGIGSLLVEKIHKTAFEKGYETIFHALMYEKSPSTRILSGNTSIYHTYLLFGKELW